MTDDNDDGTPAAFDQTPSIVGETPEDLRYWLKEMEKCLDLPVIDAIEFKGYEGEKEMEDAR